MEGHLTYKIGDTDRVFFFGNYALEETLNHFDASISDISDLLNKKFFTFMRVFIFHAASYPVLKKNEVLDFSALDVHDWIDKTGGATGGLMTASAKEIYRCLGMSAEPESDIQKKSKKKS